MAGKKKAERLEVVHPDCAGIDVGKRKHYVAVDPLRFEEPVRHFGAFTRDLEADGGVVVGVRGSAGGDGVHGGVLDPGVRVAGAGGFGGCIW